MLKKLHNGKETNVLGCTSSDLGLPQVIILHSSASSYLKEPLIETLYNQTNIYSDHNSLRKDMRSCAAA